MLLKEQVYLGKIFSLLISILLIVSCDSDNGKSYTTTETINHEKEIKIKPVEETPKLITQIENLNFLKKNGFYLSSSWGLSEAYYGPGEHKNFSYSSSGAMGIEVHIKNGVILESISLSNSNQQSATEFVKLFYKDINEDNLKAYLENNLNKSINQIYQTIPLEYEGNKIYAGSILYGNTLSIKPTESFKEMPREDQLGKKDSYTAITRIINKQFTNNLDKKIKKEKLEKKFLLLANYKETYNLLPETDVYLYYDGLDYGPIYDQPGAKVYDAKKLGEISFVSGPVKAIVLAHKGLEGGRNYFYVYTKELQGWMGRPYIMKNKAGDEFFMPNPLTGESQRKSLKISNRQVKAVFKSNYQDFIPSYESIDWDHRIPERYRREGYEMYVSSLQEGYRQHQNLVNSYLSGTW